MAQDAQINLIPGSLPEAFCPQTEQERLNAYAEYLSAELPGEYSTFVKSSSQPGVDQQNLPWIQTNADGSIVGIFTFSNGAWVRPHPIPAGPNGFRAMWSGDLADLDLYEGGDAGAITATTGAFWELDSGFDDKIPRGATATVPVGTDSNQLTSGSSSSDQVRGVYFIKRSARVYYVA